VNVTYPSNAVDAAAALAAGADASAGAVVPTPWTSTHPCMSSLSGRASQRMMASSFIRIEAVKKAGILGIIAGTLGVKQHTEVMAALRAAAAAAHKHVYTFLVGKLSGVKLGNFPEVDAFILVACPENSLLDAASDRDYVKPIVTPQEALIALTAADARGHEGNDDSDDDDEDAEGAASRRTGVAWRGRADVNFKSLIVQAQRALPGAAGDSSAPAVGRAGGGNGDYDVEGADVLGDGLYAERSAAGGGDADAGTTALALRPAAADGALSTAVFSSPALAFAASKRTWRGLEYDVTHRETAATAGVAAGAAAPLATASADGGGALVVSSAASAAAPRSFDTSIGEGMAGVASSYSYEPAKKQ